MWLHLFDMSQNKRSPTAFGVYLHHKISSTYAEESVNRSQIDVNRNTDDIRTWKKRSFLDITSNNTDTLVPSLYQRVKPAVQEYSVVSATFALPFQLLRHQ
jgi:hypothetical protein